MTKREKDEAFNEYAKRGPRELAGLLVQADEAFEKRSKEEASLRSQLLSLQSRNEKLEEALRNYPRHHAPSCDFYDAGGCSCDAAGAGYEADKLLGSTKTGPKEGE